MRGVGEVGVDILIYVYRFICLEYMGEGMLIGGDAVRDAG